MNKITSTRMRRAGQAPKSRGFTLLEAIVAVVVTSVGLLGVAALQGTAISQTKKASDRSIAAAQLSNLVARMKSSQDYWRNVSEDFAISISAAGVIADEGTGNEGAALAAETTDCAAASCATPVAMASYSLREWALDGGIFTPTSGTSDRLTNSTTTLTYVDRGDPTLPVLIDINLQWAEKNQRSSLDLATFNAVTNSNYRIRIQP